MATQDDPNLWYEHGRGYTDNRRGQYLLPVDPTEGERLDIMHTMILAAVPKPLRLHHAPFRGQRDPNTGENPRVLDLGFGTAMWLLDMAEEFDETEFYGVDIANMGPSQIYHNIDLRSPIDYESPWALGEASFDYIHMQMGLGSVGNWPRLYDRIFNHLKPGAWFEHVEIDWEPRSLQNTLPREGRFAQWWHQYVSPPFEAAGRSLAYPRDIRNNLLRAGFAPGSIQEWTYPIPTNGWSSEKSQHVSGIWFENAMSAGEGRGYGLEALSLAVLTRFQHWPPEHARRLCEEAMAEASNPDIHAYVELHVWVAQRPPG